MASLPDNTAIGPSILIVDKDTMSSELLQFRLESEGFSVVLMPNGIRALEMDLSEYALVVVDLMGTDFDGIQFTRALKRNPDTYNVPVIILSSKTNEDSIVDALDSGADDYLSKPYSGRELIARIRSVIRRKKMMSSRKSDKVVRSGSLVLDIGAGTVTIDGRRVMLTRTEYLILAFFLRNRNNFFERVAIRHEAWENDSEVSDRAVDTNISRLRKKLGDLGRHIVNRQGFGYGYVD